MKTKIMPLEVREHFEKILKEVTGIEDIQKHYDDTFKGDIMVTDKEDSKDSCVNHPKSDVVIGAKRYKDRKDFKWLGINFPLLAHCVGNLNNFHRKFYSEDDFCIIMDLGKDRCAVHIATNKNKYTIGARKSLIDGGHLDCVLSTRTSIFGEDWTRGRDLHDGKYSQETWNNIIHDILVQELVSSVFAEKV